MIRQWMNDAGQPVNLTDRSIEAHADNPPLFWTCSVNAGVWSTASGMLAVGLSWRQALGAITTGYFIIGVVITLNGTIGARLHVPFPVINRSSFGFYFSYFSVVSRAILAMFW